MPVLAMSIGKYEDVDGVLVAEIKCAGFTGTLRKIRTGQNGHRFQATFCHDAAGCELSDKPDSVSVPYHFKYAAEDWFIREVRKARGGS